MRAFAMSAATAVAVSVTLPAGAASGYAPGTGLNGSPHDLRLYDVPTDPASGAGSRICISCHAPHDAYRPSSAGGGSGPRATDTYAYLPLWNHTLPSAATTYVMYQSGPGAPVRGGAAPQSAAWSTAPGPVSLLCLSCHDGAIAVSRYGNADQPAGSVGAGTRVVPLSRRIGGDGYLGNHHPIGFDYDAVKAADSGIRDADSTLMTGSSLIRDHLVPASDGHGGSRSTLECATCHSVHNTGNGGEKLLWRSEENGALCLTCHDKGMLQAAR